MCELEFDSGRADAECRLDMAWWARSGHVGYSPLGPTFQTKIQEYYLNLWRAWKWSPPSYLNKVLPANFFWFIWKKGENHGW